MKRITQAPPRMLTALVMALAAGSVVAQNRQAADDTPAFDLALAEYERHHWAEAYAGLATLADAGHREAARIALEMHRLGPALYGLRFDATPYQQLTWQWHIRCATDCTAPSAGSVAASGC